MSHNSNKAKIEIFTSPTCPHCHSAVSLAREIAKEREDVKVIEMSTITPDGRKRAQQLGIMAVPTIFVRGPAYQPIGIRETPSKQGLSKAIDISLGLSEWEEEKGCFGKLKEKFSQGIKIGRLRVRF